MQGKCHFKIFKYLLVSVLVKIIGAACDLAFEEMEYDTERITAMSDRLVHGITSQLDHVIRNGDPERTYPGCVNLSFAFVEGESLLMALKVTLMIAPVNFFYSQHPLLNGYYLCAPLFTT